MIGGTFGIRVSVLGTRGLGGGRGGPGGGLAGLGGAARGANANIGRLNLGLGNMNGLLIGVAGAALAGVAAIAAFAARGVGLNKELEGMRLGMAATIGANLEFVNSQGKVLKGGAAFQESMRVSSKLIEEFRQDALKLPGSSQELATLFQGALNPSLAAGKTTNQIKELSKSAMTFAKVIGNDMPQAGRDLQLILTGNAGVDNKTWSQINQTIGMTAEEFNKLPKPERFEKLQKAFKAFATPEVVNAYSQSWDGLTSSLGDVIDNINVAFTGPIFKEIKSILGESLGFLTDKKNAGAIKSIAVTLGQGVANGIKLVVNYGKGLIGFFNQFGGAVGPIFQYAQDLGKTFMDNLWPMLEGGAVIIEEMIGIFADWFRDNKPMVDAALENFKGLVGWVGQLVGAFASWMGMGIVGFIGGLAIGVTVFFGKLAAMVAFVKTIPARIGVELDRIKLYFMRMGQSMLLEVKKNPILSFLFGFAGIDGALKDLSSAADQLERMMNLKAGRADYEVIAADNSDPVAALKARRLLQLQDKGSGSFSDFMGGGSSTANTDNSSKTQKIEINNYIQGSDPQATANQVSRAVKRSMARDAIGVYGEGNR
jgi:hypothetical protein